MVFLKLKIQKNSLPIHDFIIIQKLFKHGKCLERTNPNNVFIEGTFDASW